MSQSAEQGNIMTPDAIARFIDCAAACKRRSDLIKQANGVEFAYIGEIPLPGAHFPSTGLENDYQFKHPVLSTMHPAPILGTAIGAALAGYFKGNRMLGATIGGTAGLLGEGAHRLHYMLGARNKLLHGHSPLDKRFRL